MSGKIFRPAIIALAIVVLAGCATIEEDYSATRNSWQGASYDAVLAQWGQPQRYTVTEDGRYVYTWFSQTGGGGSGGGLNSSIGVFGGSGGMGIGVGTGIALGQGGSDYMRCERTLYFKEARVVEQSWLGPSRYCSLFRRNTG
ncbi:MAG: hypothetical protein JWN94_3624 [Betaproteobacteria bacterium]|nr:hypothetical protein [Betaproteobacteria bacterium]